MVADVALSVVAAVQGQGHFHSGVERGFNTFAFFTIQSNLIVGATALGQDLHCRGPAPVTCTGPASHSRLTNWWDGTGLGRPRRTPGGP